MIHEVTESLEAFLKQPGLNPPLSNAAIRFDRPTEPYSLDQTTVNLFLFEVKENLELRSNEPVVRRIGGQSLIEPPPAFAARLRREPELRKAVDGWLAGADDLAWVEWEQRKHERLLAA